MKTLILLLVVCSLTLAMVPRHKRAVNTEEDEEILRRQAEEALATKKKVADEIDCGEKIACRWVLYTNTPNDMVINNTYCECKEPQKCMYAESNRSIDVFRCQHPELAVEKEYHDNS